MKTYHICGTVSEIDDSTEEIAWDDSVVQRYYPGLSPAVTAYLAVFGAMSLKGRSRPLSLLLETPSGHGKSTVIQMAFPDPKHELQSHVYRSDKFTPKAFVSHAANVPRDELEQIDLLPKLQGKVLLSKELAPLFRGRDDEMMENFAILIAVLDGKGFTSDSGMRGQRGYQGNYVFNWIGATTPLPPRVHQMMAQLGTRLLFCQLAPVEPTEEELLEFATNGDSGEAEAACNEAMNDFLCRFFERHPVGSVDPASLTFPLPLIRQLVKWAMFLVKARACIEYEKTHSEWEPISVRPAEGPWRVVTSLKEIALGHALISGRTTVTQDDLDLAGHVAMSSVPGHLRPMIERLREVASVSSSDCKTLYGLSAPTARKRLRELSLLGIVELKAGSPESNAPDTITLAPGYEWLKLEP